MCVLHRLTRHVYTGVMERVLRVLFLLWRLDQALITWFVMALEWNIPFLALGFMPFRFFLPDCNLNYSTETFIQLWRSSYQLKSTLSYCLFWYWSQLDFLLIRLTPATSYSYDPASHPLLFLVWFGFCNILELDWDTRTESLDVMVQLR